MVHITATGMHTHYTACTFVDVALLGNLINDFQSCVKCAQIKCSFTAGPPNSASLHSSLPTNCLSNFNGDETLLLPGMYNKIKYTHSWEDITTLFNNTCLNKLVTRQKGKAKQTSQLHPGQLFLFKKRRRAALGGIRTHDTRRVLNQLSYQGN